MISCHLAEFPHLVNLIQFDSMRQRRIDLFQFVAEAVPDSFAKSIPPESAISVRRVSCTGKRVRPTIATLPHQFTQNILLKIEVSGRLRRHHAQIANQPHGL